MTGRWLIPFSHARSRRTSPPGIAIKDRVLSPREVDARAADPRLTGEDAAALASLKTALRSAKNSSVPSYGRDYFARYARGFYSRRAPTPPVCADDGTPEQTAMPPFDQFYQSGLNRLKITGPEVFLANDPRLDHIQ